MRKLKAVTFSYDDGVTQDKRLIELFDKYGLKATFNLNSALLGKDGALVRDGVRITHIKNKPEEIKEIYKNHEVAAHTLHHPLLPSLPDEEVIREVEEDRLRLSELVGYEVVGMAYPCGGVNNDERVAEIIKNNTGIKYARTITSTHSFAEQDNLFRFNPSVYYIEEKFEDIVESFLRLEAEEPQLLYIWGHSYEMDAEYITWEKFEKICARLAGRNEIFYGTNKEVFGV
jgi:peptidoglycan/xylan/chitin deacetylase (PgdA/CDA1 family)